MQQDPRDFKNPGDLIFDLIFIPHSELRIPHFSFSYLRSGWADYAVSEEKSVSKASTILPENNGFIVRLNPALTTEAVHLYYFRITATV